MDLALSNVVELALATQERQIMENELSPDIVMDYLTKEVIEEDDWFFLKQYFKDLGFKSVIDLNKQTITGEDLNGNKFTVRKYVDNVSYIVTRTVKLIHHHIKNDEGKPFYLRKGQILFLDTLQGTNIKGFYIDTPKGKLFWSKRTLEKTELIHPMIKYEMSWNG